MGFRCAPIGCETTRRRAKPKALAITYDYKGKHYLFVPASKEKVSNEILIENARKSEQPPPTKAL